MTVRHHVDRDAVDRERDVGAVIGIEPLKKVLVQLASECCTITRPGVTRRMSAARADRAKLEVWSRT
ncbi:MAG: hypothetical protein U0235_09990 [Polyangiaceae bacterium]